MAACTNDLTPIILAIASVIAIQTPILVAGFIFWLKAAQVNKSKKYGRRATDKADPPT